MEYTGGGGSWAQWKEPPSAHRREESGEKGIVGTCSTPRQARLTESSSPMQPKRGELPRRGSGQGGCEAEPNIFFRICTYTQTIPIGTNLCPPIAWHVPTHAIQIVPNACMKKLCNVYYPPTPSLGWIGQIKGRSLSLASARSAHWLAYSLHPRSLTPIWSWMQGCTKPMSTHAHPCPPKTHGYGWAWAWAPNVGVNVRRPS
jgi:hypothetical protein